MLVRPRPEVVIAPAVSPSQRRAAAASSIAEQQEGGRPQVAVPACEEPLDVGEVERHSDCTHCSLRVAARAGPARMRSFCWMLSAVSRPYAEYQTRVGTWWTRR